MFSSSSPIESNSPPFVCSNIAASGKPRVEDEDATERLTPPDSSQQRRVVRESETLAEPVHCVLLPRTLPSHRSHRLGATPACWQRPAGKVEGLVVAVQVISKQDRQKGLGETQLQLTLCTAALSHPPIGRFPSSAASSPALLLAESLTLLGWTSRCLTAARPPLWFRFGSKVSKRRLRFTKAFSTGTAGHHIYIRR